MKKAAALILSLLLLCATALADSAGITFDDPADADVNARFSDVWISTDGKGALEIWYEDGAFRCFVTVSLNDEEGMSWEYASCTADGPDALKGALGVKRHDVFDSDSLDLAVEEVGSGLTCSLKLTGSALVWDAPDSAFGPVEFIRLDAADDAGLLEDITVYAAMYEGTWTCGDAILTVAPQGDTYACRVVKGGGAQRTEWSYACAFDSETGELAGTGSMSVVTYGEDGLEASRSVVYENGSAAFNLVANGMIVWDDLEQGAGTGLEFYPDYLTDEEDLQDAEG